MNKTARQVDAYNARDLDRFLAAYNSDAVIENGAGEVLMRGHADMRGLYERLFAQSPQLRCEILQRIRVGSYVVDEEAVSGVQLEGFPTELRAAVVYRIEGERIAHVRLLT